MNLANVELLLSWLQMEHFNPSDLVAVLAYFQKTFLRFVAQEDTAFRSELAEVLPALKGECVKLHFAPELIDQIDRLIHRATTDIERGALFHLCMDLMQAIWHTLEQPRFKFIEVSKIGYFDQPVAQFGEHIAAKFRSAVPDIEEMGKCYATGRCTACVFHSMRILEKGLHAFAHALNLPFKVPIELENWQNIIDAIEAKIRKLGDTLPKGAEKDETLRFYSSAAVQFRYIKDAWRNHVSHARATYDEHQAYSVLIHVRDLMEALASKLSEVEELTA